MSSDCSCKNCMKIREHVSSLLPFKILEAIADKPLRIAGVAMAAGMSRNFNVYTTEELAAFAPLLVGAPVYIEHVAVESAAGKVTKCTYDSTSRCLLYEAEIYDPAIADKIRNGLIQHVSVGADYDALDLVDAKVPHGLSHPELSLVAVPGIPETNIQVLEHLKESFAHQNQSKVKLKAKEVLGEAEVFCVFCSDHADYFVSICQPCVDKFSISASHSVGVEKLEEKDIEDVAEKVAAKIGEKNFFEVEKMRTELNETKAKLKNDLSEAQIKFAELENKVKLAEGARDEAVAKLDLVDQKLAVSEKALCERNVLVERFKKCMPGMELLVNTPVLMPMSGHVLVLESLVPPPMVERSSMGMQRQGQAIRAAILLAKEKLRVK